MNMVMLSVSSRGRYSHSLSTNPTEKILTCTCSFYDNSPSTVPKSHTKTSGTWCYWCNMFDLIAEWWFVWTWLQILVFSSHRAIVWLQKTSDMFYDAIIVFFGKCCVKIVRYLYVIFVWSVPLAWPYVNTPCCIWFFYIIAFQTVYWIISMINFHLFFIISMILNYYIHEEFVLCSNFHLVPLSRTFRAEDELN